MLMRSYGCLRRWPLRPPPPPPLLLLLFFILFLSYSDPSAAQGDTSSPRWQTLSGKEPAVIARGGFSGIFPESSYGAYAFVSTLQLPSTPLWCDVQMTKDAVAICAANVNLDNCTDISFSEEEKKQTYVVNNRNVTGHFSVNYTYEQLYSKAFLTKSIGSRPEKFDSRYQILTVEEAGEFEQSLWLNVEHDLFYKEHDLNITEGILAVPRNVSISYISSPEADFLRNIAPTFSGTKTKLIFRIPEDETTDPSTNQTYDSLLKNMTSIKSFASGILIPKNYIWPVDSLFIHQPNSSLVSNAHDDDLELFASGFVNDAPIAFNYSYNPISEYLKFIDNGKFSVDGLLSDFPSTAWEAIRCFSHMGRNTSKTENLLVITHHGDSGDYPGCTDLAYEKAISVGADFIDCPVQVTKDGSLVCLSSVDLKNSTTVSSSPFGTRETQIIEIQQEPGIFSFNFTLEQILKNLKPEISNPFFSNYGLLRNPENKNAGTFVTLEQFLGLAKRQNVDGVMITIENAKFLVEKLGYDIIGRVMNALDDAGFKNQTGPKVMIQSSDSSTLIPFRQKTKYKILYKLDELVRDADPTALSEIKKFAHAVAVPKFSIFRGSQLYFTRQTKLVETLRSAELEVYAYVLMNEFLSSFWEFFGDAIMEIHNFFEGGRVNGVITDFPASSDIYRRNLCSKRNFSIPLIGPGFLTSLMPKGVMPPVQPPLPSLTSPDVLEPPLPPATKPTSKVPPTNAQTRTSPSPFILLIILVELLCSFKSW